MYCKVPTIAISLFCQQTSTYTPHNNPFLEKEAVSEKKDKRHEH